MVVRPNDLFSRAYSSLPTRIKVVSSNETTVAQYFFPGQTGKRHVFLYAAANLSECLAEQKHLLVFVFVTHFAPAFVIAILFAPSRVPARRLDVTVRRRTNPDVRVSRWNGETIDAQNALLVANRFSFRVEIVKTVAVALARVTGLIVADVAQPSFFRRLHRVGERFHFSRRSFFLWDFAEI